MTALHWAFLAILGILVSVGPAWAWLPRGGGSSGVTPVSGVLATTPTGSLATTPNASLATLP